MHSHPLKISREEDLAKQMSQDNIAIFSILIERVAEYLTGLFDVSTQPLYISKRLDSFVASSAFPSPLDKIDNVDMSPPYSLYYAVSTKISSCK
jgi:hypothetical protein